MKDEYVLEDMEGNFVCVIFAPPDENELVRRGYRLFGPVPCLPYPVLRWRDDEWVMDAPYAGGYYVWRLKRKNLPNYDCFTKQ